MWTLRTKSPNKFKVMFGSCELGTIMVQRSILEILCNCQVGTRLVSLYNRKGSVIISCGSVNKTDLKNTAMSVVNGHT